MKPYIQCGRNALKTGNYGKETYTSFFREVGILYSMAHKVQHDTRSLFQKLFPKLTYMHLIEEAKKWHYPYDCA